MKAKTIKILLSLALMPVAASLGACSPEYEMHREPFTPYSSKPYAKIPPTWNYDTVTDEDLKVHLIEKPPAPVVIDGHTHGPKDYIVHSFPTYPRGSNR
ncbi:MAG: hypothetical protein WAO98_03750 [Alphaproteobacteria bacterium]